MNRGRNPMAGRRILAVVLCALMVIGSMSFAPATAKGEAQTIKFARSQNTVVGVGQTLEIRTVVNAKNKEERLRMDVSRYDGNRVWADDYIYFNSSTGSDKDNITLKWNTKDHIDDNINVTTGQYTITVTAEYYDGSWNTAGSISKTISVVDTAEVVGWHRDDSGNWYYLKNVAGERLYGFNTVTSREYGQDSRQNQTHHYYFDSDGVMLTGSQRIYALGAYRYYLFNDMGRQLVDWQSNGPGGSGTYYYGPGYDEQGYMHTKWSKLTRSGVTGWFYFDASKGLMKTGWLDDPDYGQRYYLNTGNGELNGSGQAITLPAGMMLTSWVKASGKWYYLNADGSLREGWYSAGGSRWYYLTKEGAYTGWHKLSRTWYYFFDDGRMAYNEWVGGCYLTASGAYDSTRDGSWHFDKKAGYWWFGVETTKKVNGWYLFNTTAYIDGVKCVFDADGYLYD